MSKSNRKRIKVEILIQVLSKYVEKEILATILEELGLFNTRTHRLLENFYGNNKDTGIQNCLPLISVIFESYERRLKALENAVNDILEALNVFEKTTFRKVGKT